MYVLCAKFFTRCCVHKHKMRTCKLNKLIFSHLYFTKTVFIKVAVTFMLLCLKVILPLSFYLSQQQHLIIYKSLFFEKCFHLVSRTSDSPGFVVVVCLFAWFFFFNSFLPGCPFKVSLLFVSLQSFILSTRLSPRKFSFSLYIHSIDYHFESPGSKCYFYADYFCFYSYPGLLHQSPGLYI